MHDSGCIRFDVEASEHVYTSLQQVFLRPVAITEVYVRV